MSTQEKRRLLAELLEKKQGLKDQTIEEESTRLPGFPLSPAQERLWFIDQLHPRQSAYIIPVKLRLSGDLNGELLRACFDEIVERHESLRTRFFSEDGIPRQIIDPPRPLPPFEVPIQNQESVLSTFYSKPFDLSVAPLLRLFPGTPNQIGRNPSSGHSSHHRRLWILTCSHKGAPTYLQPTT